MRGAVLFFVGWGKRSVGTPIIKTWWAFVALVPPYINSSLFPHYPSKAPEPGTALPKRKIPYRKSIYLPDAITQTKGA